jgi:uncharacterized membrane protein YcaP (DUF421 family)
MDQAVPFDLERMIFGIHPALFYMEIAVRVVVIWLWTVVLLRWVGGRSISQMSVVEFLLVIALGSAVGDAMFYPDVPLLHAMLVILLVVLADKVIDIAFRKWTPAKRLVDGTPTEIMRDGHIRAAGLDEQGVGATEVKELLRLKGVRNLGQVELAFMEPSGSLSVFAYSRPRPGLPIVPPQELDKPPSLDAASTCCCASCGLIRDTSQRSCSECGETDVAAARQEESSLQPG